MWTNRLDGANKMFKMNKTLTKEIVMRISIVLLTIGIAVLIACSGCEDPIHVTGEEDFEGYGVVFENGACQIEIKKKTVENHNTLLEDWKDMSAKGLIDGTFYDADRMFVQFALGLAIWRDTFNCVGSVVDTHVKYYGSEVHSTADGYAYYGYLDCSTPRPGELTYAEYAESSLPLTIVHNGDVIQMTWNVYFQESGMPSGTFFTDTFFNNLRTGLALGSASFPRYHRYIYNNDDTTVSVTSNYSDIAIYTTIFESTDTIRGLPDDTLLEVQLLNTSLQIIWVDTVDKAITNGKSVRYKTKVQML